MSVTALQTTAEGLPRVSPSRLEAWDRCPAAYRFEHVLRLPQPIADQRPRLLGSVAHALVEAYVREAQATGTRPPLDRLSALARDLVTQQALPVEAGTVLAREATALLSSWLARGVVPLEQAVAVEHALAIDVAGRRVDWDAPDAFLRGRLDLVAVEGRQATVCDWKSGWLTEDDETLPWVWAPGCYAALLWAWAPRLEAVIVEYHYLRTGRVARTVFTPADAAETLAWARTTASRIGQALATPDDLSAFPPRPSTACGTCPWVNRCPAARAALEAIDEAPIPDDAEAASRRYSWPARPASGGSVTACGTTCRIARPWRWTGWSSASSPRRAGTTRRPSSERPPRPGSIPAHSWPLLATDGRTLATFLKRRPDAERVLAPGWTPSPPWFGHRKTKTVTRGAGDPGRAGAPDNAAQETEPRPDDTPRHAVLTGTGRRGGCDGPATRRPGSSANPSPAIARWSAVWRVDHRHAPERCLRRDRGSHVRRDPR